MKMQTLELRNTYTPTNVPQVRGNCDSVLNRDPIYLIREIRSDRRQETVSRSQCTEFKNLF